MHTPPSKHTVSSVLVWRLARASQLAPNQRLSHSPSGAPDKGAAASRKAAQRSGDTAGKPNVIRFRPRGIASRRELGPGRWDEMDDSSVADLREHESAPQGHDDYRQRMVANSLAAAVLVVLMITGDWVVSTLAAATRDSQTCYRPGRSNCAAIYMPNRQHSRSRSPRSECHDAYREADTCQSRTAEARS
jgi:hypothetical protein